MNREFKALLDASRSLLDAINNNKGELWESSLERTHDVVITDKSMVADEKGEVDSYDGITNEISNLKYIVDEFSKPEYECPHPEIDTEEYLENHEYKLIEFAIDDIVDRVLNETSEDLDDYDLDSVTDYVTELVEAGVDTLWGVRATDGDEEYWMDEADIDNAFDNIIRDMEDIHDYIRTGGF